MGKKKKNKKTREVYGAHIDPEGIRLYDEDGKEVGHMTTDFAEAMTEDDTFWAYEAPAYGWPNDGNYAETTDKSKCRTCGGDIRVMAQIGTGFCCRICEKKAGKDG